MQPREVAALPLSMLLTMTAQAGRPIIGNSDIRAAGVRSFYDQHDLPRVAPQQDGIGNSLSFGKRRINDVTKRFGSLRNARDFLHPQVLDAEHHIERANELILC